MCLKVKSYAKLQVASKDMIVFKRGIIDGDKFIPDHMKRPVYWKGDIAPLVPVKRHQWRTNDVELGYHSWKNPGLRTNAIFIIPTGSTYFKGIQYNKTTGYVSDQIIFYKEMTGIDRLLAFFGALNIKRKVEKKEEIPV